MKLLKTAFILLTAAILPFALVAVGNPQDFTCWSLTPAENHDPKPIRRASQSVTDRKELTPVDNNSELGTRTDAQDEVVEESSQVIR